MDCIQSREKERVKVFVAVYVSYLANKPLSLSLSLGAFNNHNLQILGGATEQMRLYNCLLYTSPSPRDRTRSRMPSSA